MTPEEFVEKCEAAYPGSPAEEFVNSRGVYDHKAGHFGYMDFDGDLHQLRDRLVLPVFHPYCGELVTLTGRTLTNDKKKYYNAHGTKTRRYYYGKPRNTWVDAVVLVEGQLDVWSLEALGIPAYGLFGHEPPTLFHIGLLRRIAKHVILWPDRGVYKEATKSWAAALEPFGFKCTLGPYPIDPKITDPDNVAQFMPEAVKQFYGDLVQ